ncbi:MAG: DUF192 domain-containing protein [Steroidobacteraceae bacterium]
MNVIARHVLQVLLVVLCLSSLSCAAQPVAQDRLESLNRFPQGQLSILTPDARRHPFQIWIADNDAHREQGLMFVKSLPENTGMLFVFDRPQKIQMWMKNTLIPLDMVFIDADGRIDSIAVNTTPMSLRIIESKNAVLGVLELAGGTTARLGIHAGAIVRHPFFASVGGSR